MEENKLTDEVTVEQSPDAGDAPAQTGEVLSAENAGPGAGEAQAEGQETQPAVAQAGEKAQEEFATPKEEAASEFSKARPKVYDKHKGLQIAGGIFSAALIWFLLGVGSNAEGLLSWLWVIVFGVVFLGKNRIERNKNIFFKPFTFAMLTTFITLLVFSIVLMLAFPDVLRAWGLDV